MVGTVNARDAFERDAEWESDGAETGVPADVVGWIGAAGVCALAEVWAAGGFEVGLKVIRMG